MSETQAQAPFGIRRTRLGMESEHFRIVVCGREQDVLLGAFPILGEVVVKTRCGFVTEAPFLAEVREPWEQDFPQRVREAAEALLERAEYESEGWCRELSGPRIWQKNAEDALLHRCDEDGHLWTGEGRCSACGTWVVLGRPEEVPL